MYFSKLESLLNVSGMLIKGNSLCIVSFEIKIVGFPIFFISLPSLNNSFNIRETLVLS